MNATQPTRQFAAMFVDFENVFYFLKNTYDLTDDDAAEASINVLSYLINESRQSREHEIIFARAYLDTDRIAAELRRLAFLGIKPEHVTSTPQKSSADIALSLDVLELMHTRREIDVYYIVGGDRDYLQVCTRLREHLKTFYVAGFDRALSAELREYVNADHVILCDKMFDASNYSRATQLRAEDLRQRRSLSPAQVFLGGSAANGTGANAGGAGGAGGSSAASSAGNTGSASNPGSGAPASPASAAAMAAPANVVYSSGPSGSTGVGRWDRYDPDADHEWELRSVRAILRFMAEKNVSEVWLKPFLYFIDNEPEFALMSPSQRRGLIRRLDEVGAVDVEQRVGSQGQQYRVIRVAREHPLVQMALDEASDAA